MKTAVVTGGTRGIGKETARDLARLGATVVIVGRDEVRGAAAAAELRETTRNERVVFVPSDLSSQADVRRLAQTLADRYERLHVLVNNAAVVRAQRQTTVDGIEETLAVCHLAPFLLTELLLPLLRRSAPARIVNVTSGVVHHAELGLDDVQSERGYHALRAYGRAKLMNLAWTFDLVRRVNGSGVSVFAVDPGIADTGTHRAYPWPAPIKVAMRGAWGVLRPWFSTERAARSAIRAASAAELDGHTGLLLDRRGRPVEPPAAAFREAVQLAVDQASRELTGLVTCEHDREEVRLWTG